MAARAGGSCGRLGWEGVRSLHRWPLASCAGMFWAGVCDGWGRREAQVDG